MNSQRMPVVKERRATSLQKELGTYPTPSALRDCRHRIRAASGYLSIQYDVVLQLKMQSLAQLFLSYASSDFG
jgi:hypothetical protein